MTHCEFNHILESLSGLSPEQMRQLGRELDGKLATATTEQPDGHDARLLDQAVARPAASEAVAARKPIWEVAADIRKSIPAEEWDKLPTDGARQLDHYIYGTPKRPVS